MPALEPDPVAQLEMLADSIVTPEQRIDDLAKRIAEEATIGEGLREQLEDRAEQATELVRRFVGAGRKDPFTGELQFQTFKGWLRAIKRRFADARFEGDEDIAFAFDAEGNGVGEWTGDGGRIYVSPTAPSETPEEPEMSSGMPSEAPPKTASLPIRALEELEGELRARAYRAPPKPRSDQRWLFQPVNYVGGPQLALWEN